MTNINWEQMVPAWAGDLIDQGVLLTDSDLIVRFWNSWLERHSGRGAAEVIGRPLFDLYPDLLKRRIDQIYRRACAGQVSVLSQRFHRYLLPMPDAQPESGLMQQSARIGPLRQGEQIIGTVTLIDDVSERVTREQELRRLLVHEQAARRSAEELEQRYRALVEASAQRIWMANEAGQGNDMQAWWEELTGQTAEESAGWGWLDVLHPEDREPTRAAWEHALETRSTYQVVYRVWARDDRYRHLAVRAVPISNPDGQFREWVGAMTDITERKRGEEGVAFLVAASVALTTSLDYNERLLALAQVPIPCLADGALVVAQGNDGRAESVVHHVDPGKGEILRQQLQQSLSEGERAKGWLGPVLEAREPQLFMQIDEQDGNAAIGARSLIVTPLVVRNQQLGVLALMISESRRRYDEVDLGLAQELARQSALQLDNARAYNAEQQARAEAEAAVRIRDSFLSIASHELKTPLTSLLGNVELVQRRLPREVALSDRHKRALQVAVEQGHRLKQMINALLDISRLEQGQLQLEIAPVDLGQLAQRIIGEIQLTNPNHTLVCEDGAGPVIIQGDALRLEQVIQNLVGNAVKYSPRGSQVTLQVERRDDRACMTVSDQGVGIPEEALPNLFQRFYRVQNEAILNVQGMGLGLFVVKEIVNLHGGTIQVQSVEGRGSSFTIYLPLGQDWH